jgi:hypothetical protein
VTTGIGGTLAGFQGRRNLAGAGFPSFLLQEHPHTIQFPT